MDAKVDGACTMHGEYIAEARDQFNQVLFQGGPFMTPTPQLLESKNVFARQEGMLNYAEDSKGALLFPELSTVRGELERNMLAPERRSEYRSSAKTKIHDGITWLLSTPGASGNYYHWTLDLMPKLLYLLEEEISPCSQIILNAFSNRFQIDMFRKVLAEAIDRIIVARDAKSGYYKEVKIPFIAQARGKWPRGIDLLRNHYLPTDIHQESSKMIYVSRSDATRRRVVNEKDILNILKRNNIEIVTLESVDVTMQAIMFNSASLVIAPHGAALTNIIYCKPGTTVIELFSHHIKPYYYHLAHQMKLKYMPLTCPYGERPLEKHAIQSSDLYVELDSLEQAIERARYQ
ncbi:MAG: glycosyltransferase family 61 protein [Cyanobacteria bacterium J06638_7]